MELVFTMNQARIDKLICGSQRPIAVPDRQIDTQHSPHMNTWLECLVSVCRLSWVGAVPHSSVRMPTLDGVRKSLQPTAN